MPIDPAKLNSLLDDQDADRARAASVSRPSVSPDDMGRALGYANERGLPATVVADNLPDYDEQAHLDAVHSVSKASPKLGQWLQQPEHAALAKDDLPVLSKLTAALRDNYFVKRAQVGAMSQLGGTLQATGDQLSQAMRASQNPIADLYDIAAKQAAAAGDAKAEAQARAGAEVFRRQNQGDALATRGKQLAQFASEDRAELTQGVARPNGILDAVTRPWNTARYYGGILAESAPGIFGAMATRNPTAAAAVAGVSQGGSTYAEERAAGKSIAEATQSAVEQGTIEAAFSEPVYDIALGGGKRRVLKAIAAEPVSEGATQLAQVNVQDAADGTQTPIAEQLLQTLDAALVGVPGGAIEAGLGTHGRKVQAVAAAQKERASLDTAVASALESKTRSRSPEAFEALVQGQVGDATVYVPREALSTLYQSASNAEAAVTDLTGSPDAWAEAEATDGEVAIPLAKYLTHLAEQHETLADHVRLQPGEDVRPATPMPTADEIQADIAEALKTARESDARDNGPAGQVYDEIYGQLLRDRGDVTAKQEAAVAQSFYQRMADRLQQSGAQTDAYQLFNRFRLNINGATSPAGPRLRGIDTDIDPLLDALRSGKLPTDAEIHGESLVSALVKAGGVQDFGGDLRSSGALRQRPGLISQSGMTLDDAVLWAHESGFINAPTNAKDGAFDNDAPDMNTLLDLLSGELGGTPHFRMDGHNATREKFRADALSLQEELADKGIDLAKLSNAEVRAAMGDAYAQSELAGEGFRRWSRGAPLVEDMADYEGGPAVFQLFHGTTADFEAFDRERANPESDFGAGFYFSNTANDVGANYAGIGPDLEQKIQLEAERIAGERDADYNDPEIQAEARAKWVQHDGATMPVYVRALNPAIVGGEHDTLLTFEEPYDEELDEYGEQAGTLVDFIVALRDVAGEFHDGDVEPVIGTIMEDAVDGDVPLSTVIEKLKASEEYGYYTDDDGRLVSHEITREALERVGFDAIVDYTVDQKFGSQRRVGKKMAGMDADTVHVIAFQPEQIKSVNNTGAFSDDDARVLYQSSVPQDSEIERLRARVATLEQELRTDALTGLRNQRAFEEDDALGWPAVAAADMDGLKKLNDAIGHEAADNVLRAIGSVLLASEGEGARFYRRSGDEFAARFQNAEDGERIMADLQARLEQVAIDFDVADADGNVRTLTYEGIGLSYGNGTDYASADAAATINKRDRLAAGIREEARGDGTPRRLRARPWGESGGRSGEGSPGQASAVTGTFEQPADGGGTHRGSVTFQRPNGPGSFVAHIDLAHADRSTFLHEFGHVWLEMLNDLADDADAPADLKADRAAVLKWLGVEDRTKIERRHHEQWAEGVEHYFQTAQAPSTAMRRAFARFKVWITDVYKGLKKLDTPLSDDIRGVMDRLLASDAEIEEARNGLHHEALITDAIAVGMGPQEYEAYRLAVEAAKSDAEASLAAELLHEQQRAEKARRGEARRALRSEVEATTRALPVYRAMRWLRQGLQPDGTPVPDPIKLSKDALLDEYGQSFLKHLVGTYAVTGGVKPDQAAALLGYDSGSELVHALVNAPKLQEVIDADTDRILAERYPDPMTDGSLADRALVAVHRQRQADVMLREVQALEHSVDGKVRTQAHVLREVARQLVADKTARQLQPASYRMAEAKAGREAFAAAAKQDWAAALASRRRQLLNHYLFTEASHVQAEVAKAGKYLARFQKTKVRAQIGKAERGYLEQIDALLERFDFRNVSAPQAERRTRLADWINAKAAEGITVDLPDRVRDEAFRKPFRDLTIAELRDVRDAVKRLAYLADGWNTLRLGKELRDRAAVDAAMASSVRDANPERPDRTGDETGKDQARTHLLQARAMTGAATDIARELDGFKDGAAVWDNTVRVIRDAVTANVNPALKSAQETIAGLYREHYTMAELRDLKTRRFVPEVNDSWSKGRILSLALNWGNEGNREALLSQARGQLSPVQVGVLLGKLDARDWAFVQGVWDHVNSYWPEIAAAQKRRTGLTPEKVDAAAFAITTVDGKALNVRGGYYPLKYEADTASTMREAADDFFNAIRTGQFSKAATKDGHTIERVGSGGRRVRLDLGVIDSHLRDVIRDIHLGDAVNYVYQAMRGKEFTEAVNATGMTEPVRALETWLKDVASGEIGLRTLGERSLRAVRGNFTAAVLTWKFVSAALQVTGIVQTSVVLGKAATLDGVQRYTRRPLAMGRYVNAASPFMAQRIASHVEAVQQVMDAQGSRFASGKAAMVRWGYWMIGRVQRTVDVATWLGAEKKGMELFGGDVTKARAYADDVVSRAQGSGEFIDKNPIQRGTLGDNVRQSEYIRATTALMGYMIAKSNAAYERTRVTDFRSFKQGAKWAGDMANLFVIEGIITAAIRGQLPSDDDDDGSWVDDWMAFLAEQGASNLFGGVPGLSQAVSELRGYDAKGIVASAWESVGKAIEQAKQGELDKAALKSAVTVGGFAFGLPSSQINKTIDAIAAKRDGQDVSPYQYLAGVPKQ